MLELNDKTTKLCNFLTGAIIARMFKHIDGAWLKKC